MPEQNTDAEAALHKLGQRLRAGHARQRPISPRSLDTVRTTVREEWEQERKAAEQQTKPPTPGRGKKPPERGPER
jgi:hypothetical protein